MALVLFGVALWSQPVLAQQADPPGDPASESSEAGEGPAAPLNLTVTSTRKPRRCGESGPNGEILVCGKDNGEDVRVPTDESNTDDGLPRAPDVSGGFDCKNSKCHKLGGVPPPVYYIDVKSIPAPPKGSDAEKVANGELSDR